jgi:hypothetical protein
MAQDIAEEAEDSMDVDLRESVDQVRELKGRTSEFSSQSNQNDSTAHASEKMSTNKSEIQEMSVLISLFISLPCCY